MIEKLAYPADRRLPQHVAVIMDGNGRWAESRGLPRSAGHWEGLSAAKAVVKAASAAGVPYLTLFTFSTENWKRAEAEVSFLMQLIRLHLRKESLFYRQNDIRVVHSGDLSRLPRVVQREIATVMQRTARHRGLTLNLAINYGGQDEIVRAVNRWMEAHVRANTPPPEMTPQNLRRFLDCPFMPDADLIIRTAGEQRVSNFLIWEAAYAELYFSPKLWPDFAPEDFEAALLAFSRRTRRFGDVPRESLRTG